MNYKVRKAIIPAAGLGTRFLPATKALPKEMLPIIDIPTIQYIVEEARQSGIEEILIVTNSNKTSIEKHFDVSYELETRLKESGKNEEVKMLRDIAEMANVYFVSQKEPKGLGHAIMCGESFVRDEPFAVLLGDDLVINRHGEPSLKQLIKAYEKTNSSILGVQKVDQNDVSKYGIVTPKEKVSDLFEISNMVEKPKVEEAPSCEAVLGRYVLTPKIFELLKTQKPGKGNEIQLTDALKRLLESEKIYACRFEGERYDVGDKFGFVKATIDFALDRNDLKEKVQNYLKALKF